MLFGFVCLASRASVFDAFSELSPARRCSKLIALFAVQTFQKELKKSETKGGLFEGKLLSQDEIKAIADLPSKEQLMAQIAGAINAVATKVAVGINEVPSGMARALKQHAEGGEG